ncbi:hypothetical protein SNEBB_006524 [Seison nebaliae]|nr:hypothetical protein SNEBB_006524 [Seison nebaliae]
MFELLKSKDKAILPDGAGGGPHGLGDPNDKTLRKVEENVCIPQKMKQMAHEGRCYDEVEEWALCARRTGLYVVFKCRKEVAKMKKCLINAYDDEEFREEAKRQFLEERSDYRRTGIKRVNERKAMYTPPDVLEKQKEEKKKEMEEFLIGMEKRKKIEDYLKSKDN